MADVLKKSNLFPETLVSEMMNLVKGKSALAALSASTPIPFNGMKEFTFTLDKEVDVVAEGGAKGKGGATVTPVTIIPVKIEYGAVERYTIFSVSFNILGLFFISLKNLATMRTRKKLSSNRKRAFVQMGSLRISSIAHGLILYILVIYHAI